VEARLTTISVTRSSSYHDHFSAVLNTFRWQCIIFCFTNTTIPESTPRP